MRWNLPVPCFGNSRVEFLKNENKSLNSFCFRIFGHHGNDADDIIYINWLNMVRAGLLALEFYSPDTHTWGQV